MINLGNLYIDMNRPDEARSLMQAARKQSPFSWDAAIGMAAYFHSINKPDKARAILDDENLDRPQTLMVAKKASKALEKTKDLPIDSPEELYKENIKTISAEPIATAADFMAQIDEEKAMNARFVERLPPQGSFKAPSIKKLTQYASLKAINSPQGESAVKDFADMLSVTPSPHLPRWVRIR
jgi:thioredoxin-like negative regulator of GroEL